MWYLVGNIFFLCVLAPGLQILSVQPICDKKCTKLDGLAHTAGPGNQDGVR
jgi:hypothetical protein